MGSGSRTYLKYPLQTIRSIKYKRHDFFKALGLELLFLVKSKNVELPKPVYTLSFKTALARSAVHLIPVCVSVVVISLNAVHLYLGSEFTGIISSQEINSFLLQLASKLHEMTIVASLTSIVLHEIRQQLVHGQGVPLGALGGAFLFTSLSFIWSPGFWGAIYSGTSKTSKARLCIVLLLSVFLAAFVGPSTATLIIPKFKWWQAGGAKIWFRGDLQEVYPLTLPTSNNTVMSLCTQANATNNPVCPSFGSAALLQRAMEGHFEIFNVNPDQKVARSLSLGDALEIIVPSGMNPVQYMSLRTSNRGNDCQSGAVAARLSEAMKLVYFWHDFDAAAMSFQYSPLSASISEYKRRLDDSVQSQTRIPMVKSACSVAQNLSLSDSVVSFPVMVQNDCWTTYESLSIEAASLGQNMSSKMKTAWVPLPASFGQTSTGLVVEGPWDMASNSRLVLGCSITAGWGNGTITKNPLWIFSGAPDYQSPWNRSFDNGHSALRVDTSWQTIQIQQQWLDMMAPRAGINVGDPSTTLDIILENSGILENLLLMDDTQETIWNNALSDGKNRTVMVEHVLSVVFAEALSREGSLHVLVPDSRPINVWATADMAWSSNDPTRLFRNADPYSQPVGISATPIQATMSLYGICYLASSSSEIFSICVLGVYTLFALCHILHVLIKRRCSGSWHNLTELIALAHNSEPSKTALKNTGAGIKELKTYGQVAVIRAVKRDTLSTTSVANMSLIFQEPPLEDMEMQALIDQDPQNSVPGTIQRPSSGDGARAQAQDSGPLIEEVQPDIAYG